MIDTTIDDTTVDDLNNLLNATDTIAANINTVDMIIILSPLLPLFFSPIPRLVSSLPLNINLCSKLHLTVVLTSDLAPDPSVFLAQFLVLPLDPPILVHSSLLTVTISSDLEPDIATEDTILALILLPCLFFDDVPSIVLSFPLPNAPSLDSGSTFTLNLTITS